MSIQILNKSSFVVVSKMQKKRIKFKNETVQEYVMQTKLSMFSLNTSK